MNYFNLFITVVFITSIHSVGSTQIIEKRGYLYSEISAIISSIPSIEDDSYRAPLDSELATWENALVHLIEGDIVSASDSVNTIGYNLIHFIDTFDIITSDYYILETIDTNYWGTYVYNPSYCRPLILQSPHAIRDANTGLQGIHIFRQSEALFYQVNGTHRCNSSDSSSCTGTTSSCSSTSTSEAYRISDLAHNIQSIFQKTTEVLFRNFDESYFIQLHGFAKRDTDPYVILSNGTNMIPSVDFLTEFKSNLQLEDPVLTFKVAHIDTDWNRLRGFWNTQGRLINGEIDACNEDAIKTSGRFFHIEQERTRLRSDTEGWNKVSDALNNTFDCDIISSAINENVAQINIYPNPCSNLVILSLNEEAEFDQNSFIYNLLGQNISSYVDVIKESNLKHTINVSRLPIGVYIIRVGNMSIKLYVN